MPTMPAVGQVLRVCRRCQQPKPRDCFTRDAKSPGGINTVCRACITRNRQREPRARYSETEGAVD